jgi:hypothetical protein
MKIKEARLNERDTIPGNAMKHVEDCMDPIRSAIDLMRREKMQRTF